MKTRWGGSAAIRVMAENEEDVTLVMSFLQDAFGNSARGTPVFANTREPGFRSYLNISIDEFKKRPLIEVAEAIVGVLCLPRCPVCGGVLQNKIATQSVVVCEPCRLEFRLTEVKAK